MTVPKSAIKEGALLHPDPDILTGYAHGFHNYDTIEEAQEAVANDELSVVGFEFVLEDLVQ